MARKESARKASSEETIGTQELRPSEHPDFPGYGEPGFAPMQEPTELTAIINGTTLELARAEQAQRDGAAIEADPAAVLPRLPVEQEPVSTERATQQLVDTLPPQLSPAEYEAKRFEAFKLDLYRVLYKHKYVLSANALAKTEQQIHVIDAGNTSRMKRQLAQAGCVESLVNLTGKVEL